MTESSPISLHKNERFIHRARMSGKRLCMPNVVGYSLLFSYFGGGLVAKSCPMLCDPMNCSPPGSSVHGTLWARILEWVAISFSRGSSPPRGQTWVSCTADSFLTEPPGKSLFLPSVFRLCLWDSHRSQRLKALEGPLFFVVRRTI